MVAGQFRPPGAGPPLNWPGAASDSVVLVQVVLRAQRGRLRRADRADPAPEPAARPSGGPAARRPAAHRARRAAAAPPRPAGPGAAAAHRAELDLGRLTERLDRPQPVRHAGEPAQRLVQSVRRPVSTRAPAVGQPSPARHSTGGSACPASFAASPSATSTARQRRVPVVGPEPGVRLPPRGRAARPAAGQPSRYASAAAANRSRRRRVPVRRGRGCRRPPPAPAPGAARLSGPSRLPASWSSRASAGSISSKPGVDAGQQVPAAVGLRLGAQPIQTEHGLLGDLGGLGEPAAPCRYALASSQRRNASARRRPRSTHSVTASTKSSTASAGPAGRQQRPGPGDRGPAAPPPSVADSERLVAGRPRASAGSSTEPRVAPGRPPRRSLAAPAPGRSGGPRRRPRGPRRRDPTAPGSCARRSAIRAAGAGRRPGARPAPGRARRAPPPQRSQCEQRERQPVVPGRPAAAASPCRSR